jgi:hypothetical protein
MTLYNVHIYREMRLKYERIEADTPEAAATIARDKLTDDADLIDDCDGETFAALVDVIGDEQFEHSVTIDFKPEPLRKVAPDLLKVCETLAHRLPELDDDEAPLAGSDAVQVLAEIWPALKGAIAKATVPPIKPPETKPVTTRTLPPDPQNKNDDRAAWAGKALAAFMQTGTIHETGTDDEEAALADLLADLMHWCDRNNHHFNLALVRARFHYNAETLGE